MSTGLDVEALRELVELLERVERAADDLADETYELALKSSDCALAVTAGRLRELSNLTRGGWRGSLAFYELKADEERSHPTIRSDA